MISGFEKLTLLDYPNHLACIIYTTGCNLKCPFCQNSSLVYGDNISYDENEIIKYLKLRLGILEGVVITGGEPLIHKDIEGLIKKIKHIGYDIKLDTNGTNPKLLKQLLDKELIDYVAMDIKNTFEKYGITTDSSINIESIKESIDIIKKSGVSYEFRTTIVKEFHTIEDIKKIKEYIEDSLYYLQNFKDGESVIKKGLHSFSKDELFNIKKELSSYKNIIIRDIEMENENV